MNESSNSPMMYQSEATVAALNKVSGFNPFKYLRRTKDAFKLDLSVQKLWFRMAHPNGPMRVTALRITEQMAIFEAQVFLDRSDVNPISVSVVQKTIQESKEYIKSAQDEALSQALSDAGFGIQFADVMTPTEWEVQQEARRPPVQKSSQSISAPPVSAEFELSADTVKAPCMAAETNKAVTPAAVKTLPVNPEPHDTQAPTAEQLPVNPEQPAECLATQEPEAEALPVPTQEPAEHEVPTVAAAYTADMPVEEILSVMTLEQAEAVIVDKGICAGKSIAQIAKERPISLRFYLTPGNKNNVVHAAAQLVLNSLQKDG